LGFAAVSRQRGRIDIEGALWIDTLARALSDVEFRYMGLDPRIDAGHPGGRIAFRAMENGLVLIDRWHLRMVGVKRDSVSGGRGAVMWRVRYEAFESGGELARASWPDGSAWTAPLGTLRMHAVTHQGTPAVGTVLRLANTDYEAVADANGDLEMIDLLPGPYSVAVVDPLLVPLGITLSTPIQFIAARDSVVRFSLDVPTAEDYVAQACGGDTRTLQAFIGTAWIVARVTTPDATPVNALSWTITTLSDPSDDPAAQSILKRPSRGAVPASGIFQFCKAARGTTVEIRVSREGAAPVSVVRTLEDKITVVPIQWTSRP
jgi:hypothetical protein